MKTSSSIVDHDTRVLQKLHELRFVVPRPCIRCQTSEYTQTCVDGDILDAMPYKEGGDEHIAFSQSGRVKSNQDGKPRAGKKGGSKGMRCRCDPGIWGIGKPTDKFFVAL